MNLQRLDLIEKRLEVMQQEISQVLMELQNTLSAIARMSSVGIAGLDKRLSIIEEQLGKNQVDHDTPVSRDGKEL